MEIPSLKPLEQRLSELHDLWTGALPAFARAQGESGFDVERLGDQGLVRVTDAIAQLRRDADALLARVAGEVARRSARELGVEGLARKQGFHNPVRLVAASTGASSSDAAKLIAVGAATAPRQSFSGVPAPARHPHVAAELQAGRISIDAASVITSMLDRVAHRADPAIAGRVEANLAERATSATLDLLVRMTKEAEAQLDQEGAELRDEQRWQERSLTMREDVGGMVHLHARLDPETAAPIKTAIDAIVSHSLRAQRGGEREAHAAPTIDDDRSIPQRQADALAAICRHALGCGETITPLAAVTIVARIDLEALESGLGVAQIDGIDQPISAGTLRCMAADAEIIPAVFGSGSLPLDLGRRSRFFTKAQRLALAERDGGCAGCGQNITYAEAHHIRWWERDTGPSDLDNGVMLCSFCHHRTHREGWEIRIDDGEVWFIPPPHVDQQRTARLGGRARFGLPRLAVA
jgi:hypothetical protein